jgi:hypothetical protein
MLGKERKERRVAYRGPLQFPTLTQTYNRDGIREHRAKYVNLSVGDYSLILLSKVVKVLTSGNVWEGVTS